MAKVKGTVIVDIERCKGCELCVVACPTNVLRLAPDVNGKGYNFAYMETPSSCTGCTNCALVCPDVVIKVYRMKPKAKEISA